MKEKIRKIILIVCIATFVVSVAGIIVYFILHDAGEQNYQDLADAAGLSNLSQIAEAQKKEPVEEPAAPVETPEEPVQPDSPEQPAQTPEAPVRDDDGDGEEDRVFVEFEESPRALLSSDPIAEALSQTTFAALTEKNSDTIGWIFMPGTDINYPILQTDNNDFYLNHTFEKLWNGTIGAIYMDFRNDPTFEDFHTIIYGHNLSGGSMFSDLNKFLNEPEFYRTHRSLYIATIGGKVYRYDVYAACEADVTGHTYRLGLEDDSGKLAYINYCINQSAIRPGVIPQVDENVLTLSTCTGHGHHSRCVVQAVRAVEFVESEEDLEI